MNFFTGILEHLLQQLFAERLFLFFLLHFLVSSSVIHIFLLNSLVKIILNYILMALSAYLPRCIQTPM